MKLNSEAVWIGAIVLGYLAVNQASKVFAHDHPAANGWVISRSTLRDDVRFSINRTRGGSQSTWTTDMPWSAFQGLDRQQLASLQGEHTFQFVRDAAQFLCKGQFNSGSGQGLYEFKPNAQYSAKLKELGYDTPDENDLFQLAFSDVSLEFATAVQSAGLNASLRDLLDLRSHDINAREIREIQAAGYTSFTAKELIELKNHGVRADFLRELKADGYDSTTREIVELKNHGVEPKFISEAHLLGFEFTTGEIVNLRNHGVDTGYLRKLKDSGYTSLTAAKIVKLHDHGID